ncbi:S9 family peptidase [Lichenifustis flavocetrariae]|uniref:S9 family peptidase n=1 Tax=Lichenifustis flavocetrariae TaxID=2949735 RepID=A0AA42CJ22_9HYPH|nr:S9 family peptidase [Lichenifustis flavocetrariae]MCW6507516.1 S9 family peptidase [Lichenifustis flavocetrariae]
MLNKVTPEASFPPTAPVVAPRESVQVAHGVELIDPYAWLRADNWQQVLKDPSVLPADIRAVLDAENAYADAILGDTVALRGDLQREMRGRIKEDDAEVPTPDGPFEYYTRHRHEGQHEIVCRKPRGGGDEQVLLDGDALAEGKPFFHLGAAEYSPCHNRLIWSADERGSELYALTIRDLGTGQDLPDLILQTDGEAVWSADSTGFFYVAVDDNHRPCSVRYHAIGTNAATDRLVYEETDPGWFVSISGTRSKRFGVIVIHDHDSSEAWLLDLAAPEASPRLVAARQPGVRYELDHRGDELFILTNADDAEDFKIVVTPVTAAGRAEWRDLVPHRRGRMIIAIEAFRDYLVRLERQDGLPRIVIRHLESGQEHDIAFDEEAYSLSLRHVAEFDSTVIRFAYSSMTTPDEIFDYDLATDRRVLRKRREIPSGFDSGSYVTRRVFATAPDGEQVPVSLLRAKTTPEDGSAPLLLYAYGAYGHATPASFGANRFSLVDRGFVFAIAHVRGGTDKGWAWYADGKLTKKTNTFTDYIAAAEYLIDTRVTGQGRIVGQGGSAGGMLIGAVANRAPHLFAGLIADVPFVDVLNTMLDADLPLTPPEWLEWGNPITDAAVFEAMRGYSPYDTVSAQTYPPILALGGLTDPRVTYWEPAKWVARLRATMTGGGPILLKTNMEAGHGGASGRFDRLEEVALEYAFALACTGCVEWRARR